MADAQLQYPAYGLIFADKACAKGLINLDIAYYKGMFSGLKDLMQTVGTDWKIADLAPSMAALVPGRAASLGCMKRWRRMPRRFLLRVAGPGGACGSLHVSA